jgi:xanthine dehydrogenase/oxidase
VRFKNHFIGSKYQVFIGVHHIDGSVIVAHGGIEMGQGINTKVAQTVASFLGIPLQKVNVKPTSNFVTLNSSLTAAGQTSESCCFVKQKHRFYLSIQKYKVSKCARN